MPRKSTKVQTEPQFDYRSFINETVDAVSKRLNYDSDPLEEATPMSTGFLILDLLYGGGIRPGWYTNFGKEQSSKTTGTIVLMAAAMKADVPIIAYSDYEGSTGNSKPYVHSILKTMGVSLSLKDVFGVIDPTTGKWSVIPAIRYHSETVGEKFFDWLSQILRELPDKRCINKEWWLVYDETKQNKAKLAEFADASMNKKYGKGIWVKAPNGCLQGIFIIDSYPAMNPTVNDEEEGNKALATSARMFSLNIPRVKGRLLQKMVAVVGTNQLRDVPMVMYGEKEREPGGNALRFNSDCRCKFTPRASGQPLWPKNFDRDTGWEIERSVENPKGRDSYRYIQVKTVKNKLSTPNRVGWLRIWTNDGYGNARGYDPVFDTIYYLYITGQLTGRGRKSMKLNIPVKGAPDNPPSVTWEVLKRWILGSIADKKEICKELGYKYSFCIRKYCFTQMQRGTGEKLYIKHSQEATVEESESDS